MWWPGNCWAHRVLCIPASMPATAYARASASGTITTALALIRLPGQTGEPYWTLTTPLGTTSRIDAPPLRQQMTPQVTGAGRTSREQPLRRVADHAHAARDHGTGTRPAENIELMQIQRAPGQRDEAGAPAPPPGGRSAASGPGGATAHIPAAVSGEPRWRPPVPMGTLGLYVKLGSTLLSDHQALADLVADALPPGHEPLRQNLADQVRAALRDKGSQPFFQEILERPVRFAVHPDGDPASAARTVTVRLGLGDPARAHQVTDPGTGLRPAGQHRSLPWDAEQIVIGGSDRAVTSTRRLWAELAEPDAGPVIPRVRATAASATTFTSMTSASVAERRYTKGARADIEDVDDAYFLFPDGFLAVRPEGLRSDRQPAGQQLPVLLSFPENLCPLKGWRPLSGEKLGVTQDQVTRDAVVGHDPVRGQDVRATEAAERIAKLLLSVAAGRERVAGLAQLAADVWARLAQVVDDANQTHKGDIEMNLSESNVLMALAGHHRLGGREPRDRPGPARATPDHRGQPAQRSGAHRGRHTGE